MLPPRVGVATCALGNSWLGARVRIPQLPGLQSICPLADLDQLEAVVAFSSGCLLWQLLLDRILRHDKFFVAEAHLVFRERHVIVIL